MAWVKGQSGNKFGRPKSNLELKELARASSGSAIQTLVRIMENEEEQSSARITAANALLDRGYGRPTQGIAAEIKIERVETGIEQVARMMLFAQRDAGERGVIPDYSELDDIEHDLTPEDIEAKAAVISRLPLEYCTHD